MTEKMFRKYIGRFALAMLAISLVSLFMCDIIVATIEMHLAGVCGYVLLSTHHPDKEELCQR